MKKYTLVSVLLLIVVTTLQHIEASPPENQIQALEMETVFALAHDQIIDVQSNPKMKPTTKITMYERYISALTRFVQEYPKEFDTNENLKDLNKFLSDVKGIRDAVKANQ